MDRLSASEGGLVGDGMTARVVGAAVARTLLGAGVEDTLGAAAVVGALLGTGVINTLRAVGGSGARVGADVKDTLRVAGGAGTGMGAGAVAWAWEGAAAELGARWLCWEMVGHPYSTSALRLLYRTGTS